MNKKFPHFDGSTFLAIFVISVLLGSFKLFLILTIGYSLYQLFLSRQGGSGPPGFSFEDLPLKKQRKNIKNIQDSLPPFKMPTFKLTHFLSFFVGLIVLFIIIDGLVSVPAGSVAVIYDRGRGVLTDSLPEGLHLKIPFWQISTIMTTRLQSYTMSIAEGEGAQYGADPIEALTNDGQVVNLDVTIQFRINQKDASKVYQTIGLDYLEKVVRPDSRSIVRDVVTGYESKELFTQKSRTGAAQEMEDKLRSLYGTKGIQLDKLLLRNVRFSDVYLHAIEEKQIAQQKIQKAEYEKQEAEIQKEKRIIEAQAEAESIKLKGQELRANPEVIQFQFVEKMSPNINWGILPSGALPLIDMKGMTGALK